MFQLARQNQRHNDVTQTRSVDRTLGRSPALAPGKRANTDNLNAAYNGTPDYYTRAVESAMRELDAIRATALPNYVAIRRKQGLDPIAKQIELAKSAMQVRHMILCANNHVYALEKAATHKDPMVLWLRVRMDRVVAQATKLGCYADAMDMLPQRFIDDTKQKNAAKKTHNVSTKTRHQAPAPTPSVFAGAQTATIRKAANPKAGNTARPATPAPAARIARGTSAPAPATRVAVPAPVRTPVQRKGTGASAQPNVQAVAARGVESAAAPLPFASVIQRAFGRHDVSSIRVQIGGAATKASQKLGAKAYATGNLIAFAHDPDLHTAAHEAAHVIQQRHGVSLAGGVDDGPSDSYERHADEVADAVVAGRSVEHMFADFRSIATAAPVVQRKSTNDSSYSFTHSTKPRTIDAFNKALKKVGAKAEWKAQWTFAVKNGGKLGAKQTLGPLENELKAGSSTAGIERSEGKFVAKLEAELLKDSTKLLEGELIIPPPISVNIESKALNAALSTEKLDFKLATVTVSLDGDFSKWWGLGDHIEVKGTVQIDIELGADVSAQLLRLAQAGREVADATNFEAKLAASEAKLAKLRAMCRSGGACHVSTEIKELEREVAKMKGIRGRMASLKDGAIRRMKLISKKLDSKAGGKLIKKIGAKALGTVFKKFIPIYNLISTAQDIYAVADFLSSLKWSPDGYRGSAGERGEHKIEGAIPTDSDIGDASMYERILDARDNVKLHAAAETVLASLATPTVTNGGEPLTADEKMEINAIVPTDMTSEDLKAVAAALAAAGPESDRVEAVARAVKNIRGRLDESAPKLKRPSTGATKQAARRPTAKQGAARSDAPRKREAKRAPVELVTLLRSSIRIVDSVGTGRAMMPPRIEAGEFVAEVLRVQTGIAGGGDGVHEKTFRVFVTLHVVSAPDGLVLLDGAPLEPGRDVFVHAGVFTGPGNSR